jgi:hypothetical protein
VHGKAGGVRALRELEVLDHHVAHRGVAAHAVVGVARHEQALAVGDLVDRAAGRELTRSVPP